MWRDQSGLRDGDPPNLEAEQNSFPFPPPSSSKDVQGEPSGQGIAFFDIEM